MAAIIGSECEREKKRARYVALLREVEELEKEVARELKKKSLPRTVRYQSRRTRCSSCGYGVLPGRRCPCGVEG
jgi:hypothetical protein